MSTPPTDIETGLDIDTSSQTSQTSQTTQNTQSTQSTQSSWWHCQKRNNQENEDENIIHYKTSRIPSIFSAYYFCCCDFLPNKKLDYQKVRLSKKYNQTD